MSRQPISVACQRRSSQHRRRPGYERAACLEPLEDRFVLSLLGFQLFPSDNAWNQNISNAPVAANSAAIIANIGASVRIHPDWGADDPANGTSPLYGIPFNIVHGNTTSKVNVSIDNYPDESDIVPVPIPANAVLEGDYQNGPNLNGGGYGENGNPNQRGDSHLLVWDEDNHVAYELYGVSRPNDPTLFPNNDDVELPKTDNLWHAAQETVWDMKTNTFRTLGATSADAAGLSILAGLARPDEGLPASEGGQGAITHALRVTLPGSVVNPQYIYPASHIVSESQGTNKLPFGGRLRLANTPAVNALIANMPPESQVVARAMQQYGLIVADIGSAMFVTGASATEDDVDSPGFKQTWNVDDIFASNGLETLTASDFEVVDLTPRVSGLSETVGAAGDSITITGQNFSGAAGRLSVLFGTTAASSVTVVDDSHITAIVPSGSGTVDVTVQSGIVETDTISSNPNANVTKPIFGYGISAVTSADRFTFGTTSPPIVELNGPAVNWTNPTAWPAVDANVGEAHQALKIANSTATIVTGSSTLQSMTVTLASPSATTGDYVLGSATGNITVSGYNRTTGQIIFTGSDTPANYLSALKLVIYNNSNIGGQNKPTETITVTVNDGTHTSNTATATLSIVQAPAVKLNINTTNYSTIWTNGGAVPITGTGPLMGSGATANFPVPVITDAEAANLSSMTVSIASVAAGDVLTFNAVTGITGAYNSVTGVATFTGSTTLANYQTELASVKYNNTSGGPGSNRTITVVTNDGSLASTAATASITVNTTGTFNSLAVGEYLFYDHSTGWDNVIGPAAVASSDNRAIDPTKVPYLGTSHASGASLSGYTNGLNGIMIDLTPHSTTNNHASLTLANLANDFSFKVSNSSLSASQFNNPAGFWTAAPAPNGMTVRLAGGAGGSDRVEITWADGAIKNQWLEVTAKASTDTGLGSPVTFFFGNLIGDTGDSNSTNIALVGGTDEVDMRLYAGAAPNPIYQAYDVDKNRSVDANDQIAARNNPGNVRIPTIAPANFAPDTGPSAGPSATTSVDTNSIPSGLAAMATSASSPAPATPPTWQAPLSTPSAPIAAATAQVFAALASSDPAEQPSSDETSSLDDELVDSLLGDLGLA